MENNAPDSLCIIAGNGVYPLLLAESARKEGVRRIIAVAFKRETNPAIAKYADRVEWLRLGQLAAMLDVLTKNNARQVVMAGQLTPTALFHIRPDATALELLRNLKEKNAHTVFGAFADLLRNAGMEVLPAHQFMKSHMAPAGRLGTRAPTPEESADIALGMKVAKMTSDLDIGQTVVVKQGTILAVEAFEGTDTTIRRAGKLGGPGAVVVKVAKSGHDMRFDIPVVGMRTLKTLKRIRATALAVEANRTILLEREKLILEADRLGLCLMGVEDAG